MTIRDFHLVCLLTYVYLSDRVLRLDPDAPSRQNPTEGPYNHWLVVNIPAGNLSQGDVLFSYEGAGPPPGTGKNDALNKQNYSPSNLGQNFTRLIRECHSVTADRKRQGKC